MAAHIAPKILLNTKKEIERSHFDTDMVNAHKEASTAKRSIGSRVKVEYDAISEEAMKQKKDSISKLVLDSIQKKK